MTVPIKNLIQNFVKELKKSDSWQSYLLINWNYIIGNLQNKVKLEKIYDDTIVLGVYDSAWMQELFLLSNILIKKINSKLDKPRIKNIKFKSTNCKTIKLKKIVTKSRPLLNFELNQRELVALEKIKDKELSLALKKFLIKCHNQKL